MDAKDDKILDRITNLPCDLKKYLYTDFVDPQMLFCKFKTALETEDSHRLNPVNIRHFIPIILAKQNYIDICNTIPEFKIVYTEHKLKNKKHFVQMNNGDSFALAILFYMYH